eukprot:10492685-Alexandrium_andersonii.AAC.1
MEEVVQECLDLRRGLAVGARLGYAPQEDRWVAEGVRAVHQGDQALAVLVELAVELEDGALAHGRLRA